MSKLADCNQRIQSLLFEVTRRQQAYEIAKDLHAQLTAGGPVAASVQLSMQVGDIQLPIRLPDNPLELLDYVASAANLLGGDLIHLWDDIYSAAAEAKAHCDESRARAATAAEAIQLEESATQNPPFPMQRPPQPAAQPAPPARPPQRVVLPPAVQVPAGLRTEQV